MCSQNMLFGSQSVVLFMAPDQTFVVPPACIHKSVFILVVSLIVPSYRVKLLPTVLYGSTDCALPTPERLHASASLRAPGC